MKKSAKNRKSGQGMTEYIMIIALVAIAALIVTMLFGKQIRTTMGRISDAFTGEETELKPEKYTDEGTKKFDAFDKQPE